MGTEVLITGAAGFIGRNVARQCLERGDEVTGIGHGSWSEKEWRALGFSRFHNASVTPEVLKAHGGTPSLVIHCAGSGSVAFSVQNPEADRARTLETTSAVLEFMRSRAPHASLVYPSSAAVYGLAQAFPTPETAPLKPISPYGAHKKMAEDLCRAAAHDAGLKVAIVRLFSVYGAGLRKQLLFDACQKARRGEAVFFGTGDETRDWLRVDDAAALLLKAGDHASAECPVANGGSGQSVSVRVVLTELLACFPGSPAIAFNGEVRPADPQRYHADIGVARSWGWSPRIDLRKGVRDYAHWFKATVS